MIALPRALRASLVPLALLVLALACASREPDPIVVDDTSTGDETTGEQTDPQTDGEQAGEEPAVVLSDDACETDADCVPAECCHAAACVAATRAPACGDVMCTTDCRFGTLDCGGGCLCFEGRCAARLSRAPELPTPER